MRRLFFTASLAIIISLLWLKQNPQILEAALSKMFGESTDSSATINDSLHSADKPNQQGLEELPFLYQILPDDQILSSDQNQAAQPKNSTSPKTAKSTAPSVHALNLTIPTTIHPASPSLILPDRPPTLILQPKQNPKPGISVGGGIEWDEKGAKAKGVKISITVPTG